MSTMEIELFSRNYEASVTVDQDGLKLVLLPNANAKLEAYLRLVLPYYLELPEDISGFSFEQLFRLARQWEIANPGVKLTEPMARLPHHIPTQTKDKLVEMAKSAGIPYNQFLVYLINKEHAKVFGYAL